jgi:hypothetical protein
MKYLLLALPVILLTACQQNSASVLQLQMKIDSLQRKTDNAYTPGFGELMSSIQLHHSKLWFAGKDQNWGLAAYEESLIHSAFKRIEKYHSDNPDSKALGMITLPMDSIQNAVARKDLPSFRRSFLFLTITCNNCHQVTNHGFNKIIVPTTNPATNQDFNAPPR